MNKQIIFKDQEGNGLFSIQDGNCIRIYDDNGYDVIYKCSNSDGENFMIGGRTTTFADFFEECKKSNRSVEPEPISDDYIGAWRIYKNNSNELVCYITVQQLCDDDGWDCVFYDKLFADIDNDMISSSEADNVVEARNIILANYPELNACYMVYIDPEIVFDGNDTYTALKALDFHAKRK